MLLEYQNIKTLLQMFMFQFILNKFLWLKKIKNNVPSTYVNGDVKWEEIVEKFYEKKLQKTNKEVFRVEKVKTIDLLTVELIKKTKYK